MDRIKLDFDRHDRLGFPEVIFGATKTIADLDSILNQYSERGENAMITKLQPDKSAQLMVKYPGAFYDEISGAFLLRINNEEIANPQIGILSGGTSDASVVNEVYYTLKFLKCPADRIQDIGVAGIHRVLDRLEKLKQFKVLIVAAGFEGALPTVIGGLLPQPIIAVPVSVGYGVSSDGSVALNAMLCSCANGITVVNIDNGYGAAMAAFRMLNQFNQND